MTKSVSESRSARGRTALFPLTVAVALVLLGGGWAAPANAVSAPLYSVQQTRSGLVGSDPLTSTLSQSQLSGSSFWVFGGDAIGEGAPHALNEDPGGLHIGVQSLNGLYAGFYALHRDNAVLAHAVISAPSSAVPNGFPNVGLYVQTGGPNVDYVFCGAVVSAIGTFWEVALATGSPNQAFNYSTLYVNSASGQPLTMGCTIDTNGQNFLAAYIGASQVYQNSDMNLGYQQPFQFFLETQTSYKGGMFYGTFQDFYLTSSDSVTVTNMPPASTAQIVTPDGRVLASAPESSGTASLAIAQYDMPLDANIQVTSLGLLVASTSSPVQIWGGDYYSLSLLSGGPMVGGLSGISTSVPAASAVVSPTAGRAQSVAASTTTSLGGTISTPLTVLSLIGLAGFGLSESEGNPPIRAHQGLKRAPQRGSMPGG